MSSIRLFYHPPYDWLGILKFLKMRALKGIEWITEDSYARTVQLKDHEGWIRVTQAQNDNALILEFSDTLITVLPGLLNRICHLFDLSARPDLITQHLMMDEILAASVKANPGLRVPGAFEGFELAVRAVLGQQITVKAATTLACRFFEAYGDNIMTPFNELTLLSPLPERIAKATVDDIAKLGIIRTRAQCIIAIAQASLSGELHLEAGGDPDPTIKYLIGLPGIGYWTAHYIAMRALRWSNAFPKEDKVLRDKLGGLTPKQAEQKSQAWCPWRSYAVLHIWNIL